MFKMPPEKGGAVVGRAKSLNELANLIKTAPLEAVLYHAKGHHFGPWLDMLGERSASSALRSLVINDKTARVALLRALRS
ncbi:Uncharacterised protein [uncultured archaeon]|nr:Uncharacterised protein [uncultured archaeon]